MQPERGVVGRWGSVMADSEGFIPCDWEASCILSREGAGPYLFGPCDRAPSWDRVGGLKRPGVQGEDCWSRRLGEAVLVEF